MLQLAEGGGLIFAICAKGRIIWCAAEAEKERERWKEKS